MDYYNNELYHFGVKGMKWGVRRYQNSDGTLTAKGQKRYAKNEAYRQKMVGKAQRRAKLNEALADEATSNIKDLKKHGVNSKAYKDWKDNQYFERSFDYDWDNRNNNKKYSSSGTRLFDEVMDAIGSKSKVQDLIDENYASARRHKESAKRWMDTKSNLMAMEISALTKKKDIKKVYRE